MKEVNDNDRLILVTVGAALIDSASPARSLLGYVLVTVALWRYAARDQRRLISGAAPGAGDPRSRADGR